MRKTRFLVALFCAALVSQEAVAQKPLTFMPFDLGSNWKCVQAPGGGYSHQGNLKYSYDFVSEGGITFEHPVLAPMNGTVMQMVNNIPDWKYNAKGEQAMSNSGWGNMVTIKDDKTGMCLRMCHFKQGSIQVVPGQQVKAYQMIGQIGMTGLSTGPHLHVHLQQDCYDSASIPVGFVEGPISAGTVETSELTFDPSILDENGATNLGNHFSQSYVQKNGEWESGNLGKGFVGDGYLTHKNLWGGSGKFSWKFKVDKAGFYLVFAKWTAHPNRDPVTKYMVFGTQRVRNQQYTQPMNWNYLGWAFLVPYLQHTISVQGTTPGAYVAADGIILIKIF